MRKSRRGKIGKVSGIVAGIVLVLLIVLNGFTQIAYGESLIDIIKNVTPGIYRVYIKAIVIVYDGILETMAVGTGTITINT